MKISKSIRVYTNLSTEHILIFNQLQQLWLTTEAETLRRCMTETYKIYKEELTNDTSN